MEKKFTVNKTNKNSDSSLPGPETPLEISSMYKVDNMEYYDVAPMEGRHKRSRIWHEREIPVRIVTKNTAQGIAIKIRSKLLNSDLELEYPNSIWKKYPKENKIKLVDNAAYIFTAHLPMLLKGNIRLEYNTGYPQSYSWAQHCFMKHLTMYWYEYRSRGSGVFPLLKTLLNSRAFFSQTADAPPEFPMSNDEIVLLPFTFGKDSFLTYHICKELGLQTILLFFNDPLDINSHEGYYKKILFKEYLKIKKEKVYYFDNPLESLREQAEGNSFGWELLLTSWAILSLPVAYKYKAGYILFSNEKSVNAFFYDNDGFKVVPEFEQNYQATEEISLLTQALSEGEVYTSTFLQGLNDLAIVAILRDRYYNDTFKYLMSCWEGEDRKRWCGNCSKCARLYLYISAMGVNPIKEAGFVDNMFLPEKSHLYNVFGRKASGSGWDSFGLNKEEQMLAFYICWLRGVDEPLVNEFAQSELFEETKNNFRDMVDEYFYLHEETTTPPQWKKKIDKIFNHSLRNVRKELRTLRRKK